MISNTKESDLVNILSEGVHGASGNNPSISSAACSTGPPHASSAPSVTNAESGSGAGHQDNLGRAPSHTPSATGQPSQANSGLSCQQLFTPSGLPEVMRLVSESSKEDEKKYVLPAAIPGFHISATQIRKSYFSLKPQLGFTFEQIATRCSVRLVGREMDSGHHFNFMPALTPVGEWHHGQGHGEPSFFSLLNPSFPNSLVICMKGANLPFPFPLQLSPIRSKTCSAEGVLWDTLSLYPATASHQRMMTRTS